MSFDLPEESQGPNAERSTSNVERRSAAARTPPWSQEAEQMLLAVMWLDPEDVIPRCQEARVGPESFFLSAHQTVAEVTFAMFAERKPVDISTVAEELKTRKLLEHINSYAFLAQVSATAPTTAQASYFIEKVRELALLRDIIRSANGTVEDCHNFTGGIEEFVREKRERLEGVFDGLASAGAMAAECEFKDDAPLVEEQPAYWLGGVPVATRGNLMNIVAQSGVGKSAAVDAIIAATVKHPKDTLPDCLQFSAANNERGAALLHFDTEQSPSHYQRLLKRAKRRARVDKFPAWFHSYHLTGKDPKECREIVRAMLRQAMRKHGAIFAVIVDGWGDLCVDPNDTQECFPFVTEMHKMAIKFDCPIIGVLHLNPGNEGKSRGHLGSQLERKCETVLKLEMNDDMVTCMYAGNAPGTKKRGAPIMKAEGPRFAWDNDHAMHCTVGDWAARAAEAREAKKAAKKDKNPGSFREAYSREEQVNFYPAANAKTEPRPVIQRRARETSGISEKQFDRLRLEFLSAGWIIVENGLFRRTTEGDLWAARRPRPVPAVELPINGSSKPQAPSSREEAEVEL